MMIAGFVGFVLAGSALASDTGPTAQPFAVTSADGTIIQGQADLPAAPAAPVGAVVMAAGTGAFDRDVRFGTSGGPRDLIFADLSRRLTARGVSVVRYDKRGVAQGGTVDPAVIATATTDAQRDDLASVYEWARAENGLGARCVALFGHSEGMAHIGRLASSGAPAPAMVYGVAALVDQPARNFRWNFVDRIPASLTMLDADGDGFTSDAEIDLGWETTPAAVELVRAHFGHPDGGWSREAIEGFRAIKSAQFDAIAAQVMATPDEAPWPSAEAPQGVYQWWKSWWLDDTPVAERLAAWDGAPVRLLYGDRDSQTRPDRQLEAAQTFLGSDRLDVDVIEGVGHTLGPHVAYGPMNEDLANQVADEIAHGLSSCMAEAAA